MNHPLPLYPGAEPCVNSGYCCKKAACGFGLWDADKQQCAYLTEDNLCGKYRDILALPVEKWSLSPAFGAGCGSPLNDDHRRILALRFVRTPEGDWQPRSGDAGIAWSEV